jgi:probable HAF family extracellular repeat protein
MTGKLLKTTGMAALAAATLTAAMTSGARAQAFEDIGDLGGGRARVEGINASGQVVGSAFTAGGAEHAIIWRNGAMTDLGVLGGGAPEVAVSRAYAINDAGSAVGFTFTANGTSPVSSRWAAS